MFVGHQNSFFCIFITGLSGLSIQQSNSSSSTLVSLGLINTVAHLFFLGTHEAILARLPSAEIMWPVWGNRINVWQFLTQPWTLQHNPHAPPPTRLAHCPVRYQEPRILGPQDSMETMETLMERVGVYERLHKRLIKKNICIFLCRKWDFIVLN